MAQYFTESYKMETIVSFSQ